MIVSCSGAKHIAKKIARKAKLPYQELEIKKFPDSELNVRFPKDIKNKNLVFIQSFYGNVNEKLIETLLAIYTARDLKAKKIFLVSLYFPYFRKDKRFKPGECISIEAISKLFKIVDKLLVVEPHLHRIKKIKDVMPYGRRITIVNDIANYCKNIQNPLFIGPDMESFQWAKHIAKILNKESLILRKTRYSSRKVKIKVPKINLKDRNMILIDDIVSTGHTMLETIKQLKKFKPRKIYCIAIHGLYVEDALKKLSKHSKVISSNTIPSKASKIDISNTIVQEIKNV